MIVDQPPRPEFSRTVVAADVGVAPVAVTLSAEPGERAALARRFGLQGIDSLVARARYVRVPARDGSGPVVRVEIELDAEVTQVSVANLEPIKARVEERGLIAEYALAGDAGIGAATVDVSPEGIDPPEPLTDGRFDLGELVAEYLVLALDPYPRGDEGGQSLPAETQASSEDEENKPFADLRYWRKKDGSA